MLISSVDCAVRGNDDGEGCGRQSLREARAHPKKMGSPLSRVGVVTQVLASLGTLADVIVAISVAIQGQHASQAVAQVSLQQAEDNQLSAALSSLGSGCAAERIAGLVLLEQNAADRVLPASIAVFGPRSAYGRYSDVREIFSGQNPSLRREFI